jgi:hypothetical protein
MVNMKRSSLLMAATAVAAMVLAASASAAVIELGATSTPIISYTCPSTVAPANCTIVLTRVTALPTISDGLSYPTKVKKSGRIVGFTVGLSKLSSNRATAKSFIHSLDVTYGGTTQAAVTVLRPVGPTRQRRFKVVAVSEVVHLQPYLGQVVQIPLLTSLPVRGGDVVGLSTPTWVPVLQINVNDTKFAYRQSRSANCNNPPKTSQAQLRIGQTARYGCDYAPDSSCPRSQHHLCGTRVEFSATEITNPTATK